MAHTPLERYGTTDAGDAGIEPADLVSPRDLPRPVAGGVRASRNAKIAFDVRHSR